MSLWPVNNQKMWERLFLPVASCVHVNWLSVLFRQTLGIALKSVDSAIDGLSDEQFQMFLSLLCSSDHTWHSGSVIWWTACKDTYTRWFRGFYYVYVISYCNNVKLGRVSCGHANDREFWKRIFFPTFIRVHLLSTLIRQTLGIALKSVDSAIDGLFGEEIQMFLSLRRSSDHTEHCDQPW